MSCFFIRIILLGILSGFIVNLNAQNKYAVYFFLLEDCKITQAYIPEIKKLKTEFESDSIEFKAFFPSPVSEPELVKEFMDKYQPGLNYVIDDKQLIATQFGITVMPEVVVYQENTNRLLYQGRIDNLFARVGKRRSKATVHDLRDCLTKIQKNERILPNKTQAIGCFLNRL
jgi:hypothetical protein